VLLTLVFKGDTQACAVAIEFHPIPGLVDQPLGAGLWEGTPEQLTEELSTDSLSKSSRAFGAPLPSADVVPSAIPSMALFAFPQ
jgi:hypothetical protein